MPRVRFRRAGRMLAAGALLATAAGCLGGDEGGASEPPLDETIMTFDPDSVDPRQVDYPLDPYWPDNDYAHLMGRATSTAALDCMRRFGLDLPIPEPRDARPFPLWDHYGLWDEVTARDLGYESPGYGGNGKDFFELVFEAGQEWMPLVTGDVPTFNGLEVPEGGCQGEAHRALGLDQEEDVAYVVEGLQDQAASQARQHSAVTDLVEDWSACLRQAGWEFEDPMDPFRHFQGETATQADEVTAALADIGCKKQTGLLQTWVAADVAYQRVLAEENSESLRAVAEWLEELRGNANEIIAGAG